MVYVWPLKVRVALVIPCAGDSTKWAPSVHGRLSEPWSTPAVHVIDASALATPTPIIISVSGTTNRTPSNAKRFIVPSYEPALAGVTGVAVTPDLGRETSLPPCGG